MSSYREQTNAAKAVRRGIEEVRPGAGNKKKAKVKGPWKVIANFFGREIILHHCETEELAQKMQRKHAFAARIEHRLANK